MKVKIVKNEDFEAIVLDFEPENDDEGKMLEELWGLNSFLLHRANYERIEGKIKNISFWIKELE